MGLSRDQALDLTPAELDDLYQGLAWREDRERERVAWIIHWTVSALIGSKKAPTVAKLLGRESAELSEAEIAEFEKNFFG